ncbi:hypothetical protein CI109_102607 [Kwoniella shandongensis]|uniref:Dolichyldiphosphatase n=1 Tax=Kwoniella shandongensis TaxID=1734106 RepID=A0A5M6BWB6_9TREE|nr:uncharacterized protein CI109_005189 [Kwoniella shandongensis]KAA5526420.1 hypothetical protein CI109_005189 [Kwoniella shandongensis]
MSSLDPTSALSPLPPLKSFSLTHILYDPTHPLSIPLTLLSLSPIFLFVSYFTLLIFTRRLTILLLAVGQIGNEVLSWILKRLFKGERPYIGWGEVGTGYGMPSSHSQAAGFLVAWGTGYALTLAKRGVRRNGGIVEMKKDVVRRWRNGIYVLGLVIWSLGVSYSRWHLHYHTPIQIVAGYGAGLIAGSAYFAITEYIPIHHPDSLVGRIRLGIENVWEGIGGAGGWELGDAPGGWGEGWLILGSGEEATGMKTSNGVRRKGKEQ